MMTSCGPGCLSVQHTAYLSTHQRTDTHLYLAQHINALHQKHSSASPLSLQSHFPANNNVVLDSADPSDFKTGGTLGALKS